VQQDLKIDPNFKDWDGHENGHKFMAISMNTFWSLENKNVQNKQIFISAKLALSTYLQTRYVFPIILNKPTTNSLQISTMYVLLHTYIRTYVELIFMEPFLCFHREKRFYEVIIEQTNIKLVARVTRLSEFSPNGWLFTLDSFWKLQK
jgi:hypothetical protein